MGILSWREHSKDHWYPPVYPEDIEEQTSVASQSSIPPPRHRQSRPMIQKQKKRKKKRKETNQTEANRHIEGKVAGVTPPPGLAKLHDGAQLA